jgi:O-antigen/teichoic acid export membrane protein
MIEPPAESLTRRVVRGVGLSGSGYLLTQLITLATYLVLARLATPRDFGDWAAATILVAVGLLFTESGMLAALIQRRSRIEEAANTALIATLTAGICGTLIALAAAPLVGSYFRSDQIGAVAAVVSGELVLRSMTVVPNAMMERRLAFLRRTIVEPLAAVAFAAAAIVACAHGLGVWGLLIGNYVQTGVDVSATWVLARWRPRPSLASLGMWRELVRYGRHVVAAGIIQRVADQTDRLLVGRFVGTSSLGQYQYALRVAQAPYAATLAVASHVLYPAFARISEDPARLRSAYLRSLRWVMAAALPISLGLLPLGEPLIVLVFGDVWRPAGHALMAMCLFAGASALLSINLEGAKAIGRPEILAKVHAAMAVTTVAAMAALVAPFGLYGVAAGLSVGAVAGAAYASLAFTRAVSAPLKRMLGEVWPAAAAALIMAGTLYPIEHLLLHASTHGTAVGLVLLTAEICLGAAVYLAGLAVLAPATVREGARAAAEAVKRAADRRRARLTQATDALDRTRGGA